MRVTINVAKPEEAMTIAAIRTAAASDLTARYGQGSWSRCCTERAVLADMRHATVYVARSSAAIVGTLVLQTKKPWAIDRSYFTACARPLYLTAMAVPPERQRQGVGRQLIASALDVARRFPANAIFLDAFDAAAGAGDFYRKCGFRETGRAKYRTVPLIYFELLV